jgi:hypothetical protein
MMRITIVALTVLLGASAAFAQDAAPAAPSRPTDQGQGPLVLEPVHTPFVAAPEYKVTQIDGDTRQLVGAHAGWLLDDRLLVGGAGYWLADGSHDVKLAYGGLLVGWTMAPEHRVRFGGRGLVGGGTATLASDVAVFTRGGDGRIDPRVVRFGGGPQMAPVPTTIRVRGRDEFFVLEPQANATTRITDHIGVDLSVGYRWTAFADFLRDRVDGVTGSLALQFGW